jgi:hypothetical protein
MLLTEARLQPVLMVVEDLHWIDSETQAFLDAFVDSLPTVPLLLLVNYRPEYTHGWGSKTFYTQIRLDALGGRSIDELLEALVGSDPGLQHVKALLIERTAGNPFFEESVRTRRDGCAEEPVAHQPSQPINAMQAPASVRPCSPRESTGYHSTTSGCCRRPPWWGRAVFAPSRDLRSRRHGSGLV